ncbi:hypothetical protein BC829DRAFT_213162 [Chytridium lagenaria]|nr:hypothetical protein BC829DRAFT_213162 [Chytridium lagenaria]
MILLNVLFFQLGRCLGNVGNGVFVCLSCEAIGRQRGVICVNFQYGVWRDMSRSIFLGTLPCASAIGKVCLNA